MHIFGANTIAQGGLVRATVNVAGGRGAIVSIAGEEFNKDATDDIRIVVGFSSTMSEDVSVSKTLGGGNFLNAFGASPDTHKITVLLPLRDCNGGETGVLDKAVKAHRDGRASKYRKPATMTLGAAVFSGFLVVTTIVIDDPAKGIAIVTFELINPLDQDGN